MEDWIEVAFECSQPHIQTELRIQALNFLAECWINYQKKIEESDNRALSIINVLLEGCHDANLSILLGTNCLAQLFRLLKKLGEEKNQYAPMIYKALSSELIQNIENINMRELSLYNFSEIFSQIPQIPVGIMLEPYLTKIMGSQEIFDKLNVCDFEFLNNIVINTKLNDNLVVQLMDLLGKVLLNNVIFSNIVHQSILDLLNKYHDSQQVKNYIHKFIKVTLSMYYASEKTKKPKEKVLPLYNNQSASKSILLVPEDIQNELMNAQKRAKTVQILKSIAELLNLEINQKMKPLVAHTAIQLQDFFKKENKGLMAILECFGNPQEIVEEYRVEYQDHIDQIKKKQEEDDLQQEMEDYKNMNEIERKVKDNFQKYGIGLKKKKVTLTKEEQYKLAQLRKPAETDPKVLQVIEDKKKDFIAKQENEQKKKEAENQQIERQKQQLRKQLEQRNIQQGVAAQNKPDMEANLLFEFNTKEKELKQEKKVGLPEIKYFDLNNEEDRDKQMVDILLKKYHKLIRSLFIKYSNSSKLILFSIKYIKTQKISRVNFKFQLYLRVYQKKLNQIFNNKLKTFDKMKDRTQTIIIAEVWKIIKDYELTQYLSQDEHKALFRAINVKYFNQKNDIQQLDFHGFEQYIIQFSYMFCSKQPEDYTHLPIGCCIQKFIDYLKSIAKKQGQNTVLFDDPDKLFQGQSEVIEEFNKKLKDDPDTELPEIPFIKNRQNLDSNQISIYYILILQKGYKKVQEKEIKFNYEINPSFKMPLGFKYGYEILNDILIQNLGFSIIEPKTQINAQYKAQPQVKAKVNVQPQYMSVFDKQEQEREMNQQSKSSSPQRKKRVSSVDQDDPNILNKVELKIGNKVLNPILSNFGNQNKVVICYILILAYLFLFLLQYGTKRVLEIDQYRQLPVNLKMLVSKNSAKDRYTCEQVAFVIDDIIEAVEQGKQQIRKQGLQGISNHFKKQKEDQQKEKEQESKEQLKRIKERKIELNEQLDHQKKQKEEDVKKKEEEKKAQEEIDKKKLQEEKRKRQVQQELRGKVQEYHKQKEEQKIKEKEEKEKTEKEKRKKQNEQFEQFNQSNQQKLREDWMKKKNESVEKQAEYEQHEEKQRQNLKKINKKIQEDNQERLEKEKVQNQKIFNFIENPSTKLVFQSNESTLNLLFDFLERYTFKQITNPCMASGELPLKVFSWFCFHFNLYPEIITPNEVILIFRSLTKNKPSINGAPTGLNKDEFFQALARICIKGANIFNKFTEKTDNENFIEKNEVDEILKKNEENQVEKQRQENEQQNSGEQLSSQININSSQININSSMISNSPSKNTNKIFDEYTYIDESNSLTLQSLINYLGIPPNKSGANNFFKQKLEQKHQPDSIRKKELLKKLHHDPQDLFQEKSPEKGITKVNKKDSISHKSNSPKPQQENTSIIVNNNEQNEDEHRNSISLDQKQNQNENESQISIQKEQEQNESFNGQKQQLEDDQEDQNDQNQNVKLDNDESNLIEQNNSNQIERQNSEDKEE